MSERETLREQAIAEARAVAMAERKAILEQAIAEARDNNGAPPWARYPEIPVGSIGWRMGHGEWWLVLWDEWLSRQPTDRAWRSAYLQRHAPAPRRWAGTAYQVLAVEVEDEDEIDDELMAQLDALGVVGDDVAMGAWKRLHGASPPAPWASGSSLRTSVRHGARELDFWARWCAARRAEGSLAEWLKSAPPAAKGWKVVREAAARGVAPEVVRGGPLERLGVLLAAHGQPPAPWRVGEAPDEDKEPEASYTGAWGWWVLVRFDDTASWKAYLRAQGPCPAAWTEALARMFPWLR
jgi:hypothetical protein